MSALALPVGRLGELSPERRRLATLAVGIVLVLGLCVGLGLGLSSSPAPPDTGAARLVPADALAYLNVSLNEQRPGVRQVAKLISRLPSFALGQTLVQTKLAALVGSAHPAWLGDEAALAVLPTGSSRAGSLELLAVRRRAPARRYLASLPASRTVYDRGVELRELSGGSYVALLGRYVVAGQLTSVQAAVSVQRGSPSLAGSSAYQRASSSDPPGRVLDLYAPAGGISALLGGRTGALGAVRTLLLQPGLIGASASLSAAPRGLALRVHSVFAPGSGRTPGQAADAGLLGQTPQDAAFAIDVPTLPAQAARLLSAAAQIGVGSAIGPLLSRLGAALHAEGYDVAPLLSLFSGSAVVSVTDTGGRPNLLVLTRTDDPSQARIVLANLAPSLASLFPAASSRPGVAPLFTGRQVDGMTIHQLQLGAGLQVDYSIYHHLVGVSTSFAALTSLARSGGSLGKSGGYRAALGGSATPAGSLVFADLKVLIRLGEQTRLLHGSAFDRLAPDLDQISVIGLRARGDKTESTSELYFNIP